MVAGVDSFLVGPTLAAYEATHRLPTAANSNGSILARRGRPYCWDPQGRLAFRNSAALPSVSAGSAVSDGLRGAPCGPDGLVEALRAMYADGKVTLDDADYRYTDCNGEQYWFKDYRLALNRVVRKLKSGLRPPAPR